MVKILPLLKFGVVQTSLSKLEIISCAFLPLKEALKRVARNNFVNLLIPFIGVRYFPGNKHIHAQMHVMMSIQPLWRVAVESAAFIPLCLKNIVEGSASYLFVDIIYDRV
jgi:hypothetical protein